MVRPALWTMYNSTRMGASVKYSSTSHKMTKYKRLGSPEVYAVLYHDTGHVITTAKEEKHLEDIREMDIKGKFGFPIRLYPIRQLL